MYGFRPLLSITLAISCIILTQSISGVAVAEVSDITPFGEDMILEKSTLQLYVPENNLLPWAFVEGIVENAVPDHPVIIQIYDHNPITNDSVPVHFAQVGINEDNTYEYRFRVTDIQGDSRINIFEGNYVVKVFKVMYTNNLNLA